MRTGQLRKMFPGANTSQGFFSFYDHIIAPNCTRIIVIKGGPGVGKSSMMKAIGLAMQEKGFDIEHHCCSSDNGSIDGVVIPAIGVALMDGTAPHIVDPKNPGAVDEIIHLGDNWNEAKLRAVKDDILQCNRRVGRLFKMAYSHIKEAKVAHDEWESYITESMSWGEVNRVSIQLREKIFTGVAPDYGRQAKIRRLFANAVTPQGLVNYVHTLLAEYDHIYSVAGEPGTGKSTILEAVAKTAYEKGLDTEVFHCTLDPQKIDLVLIPALGKAVISGSELLKVDLANMNKRVVTINLNDFIEHNVLSQYSSEIAAATKRFWDVFNRAASFVSKAKAIHDDMENFYIPAMDFAAINERKDQLIQRILMYAREQGLLEADSASA